MAKGENIFLRKDGRWEARYFKTDGDGKRRYGYCYGKTYAEVKQKVEICRARELGVLPEEEEKASIPRFSEYCDKWLDSRKRTVKESTFSQYHRTMETHIRPALGELAVTEIDTETVDRFTESLLQEKHLTVSSAREVLVQLKSILHLAVRESPQPLRPVDVNYPRDTSDREIRVLTMEEQITLTEYLLENLSPMHFGVLLTLHTGLRLGELCALRWECIDLEKKTLEVKYTLQRIRDADPEAWPRTRLVLDVPKSRSSQRVIPLTDSTVRVCQAVNPGDPERYVLTGDRTPMESRTAQYALARATEACGLEGVHFHTLRHTFATRSMEQDFETKALAQILGHANIVTTLQNYVHPSLENRRANMKKLEKILQ